METKDFIRQYESLKSCTAVTLQERLSLEKNWLSLHLDMVHGSRKLAQKRKKELSTFINKTFENGREISQEIASMLSNEPGFRFLKLVNEYTGLYLKSGIKALYGAYARTDRSAKSFEECIAIFHEKERLSNMSLESWKQAVERVCLGSFTTRKDSFEQEKACLDLFFWKNDKKISQSELGHSIHTLNEYFYKLSNAILSHLGYELTVNQIAKTKGRKANLQKLGILAYLEALEHESYSPVVEMLLRQIAFVHPKDEFPTTRAMKRHFIIHEGPTNSGKTYHALRALKSAASGAYLAPLRLLALEIRDKMQASGIACDLITGEEIVAMPGAKHRSSTIETANFNESYDVAVIDEMQFIEDSKRGYGWLRAICGILAPQIHICGASHAVDFIISLIEECGDTYEVIRYERQTPLVLEEESFDFPYSVRKGDALIAFTKAKVMEFSDELRRRGFSVSVLYGRLPAGTRQQQVSLFVNGESDVLVATDVVGIGLNLPIERVVLMDIEKFDGNNKRLLTTQEIKQIAGRAGRRGHHVAGFVNAPAGKDYIAKCLYENEESVKTSVVMPTSRITDLPLGTLRQRLTAWQQAELSVPYLQKADISEQIHLLKQVEEWEHELDIKDLFKAIYIPFDSKERPLLLQWTEHVEELKEGKKELKKPRQNGSSLMQLETYYHQLHLYYQFGKKFKMNMDMEWFQSQKRKTSHEINRSIFNRNTTFTA